MRTLIDNPVLLLVLFLLVLAAFVAGITVLVFALMRGRRQSPPAAPPVEPRQN